LRLEITIVVKLPFCPSPVALPVLFRLWRGTGTASQVQLAAGLMGLLAGVFPAREVHGTGDAAFHGEPLVIKGTTWTARLPSNAVLSGPKPEPTGKRGRPRAQGDRIGACAPAAAALAWVKDPDSGKPYDLGLFTLDTAASPAAIAERYSWRWPIEPSNAAGKQLLGVGEACNRTARAVERTVPSGSSSRPCSSPGTPAPPPIPPTSPGAASSARGTPPRPRRRPATCSPGSAAARRGPDFGHLPRSEPP
jgi:hypothetical protein